MTAVLTIVRATGKRLQGERRLPFFLIGLPILVMLLVGSIFGTGPEELVVGAVAPENDSVAIALVKRIDESAALRTRTFGSAESVRRNVRRGRISAGIIVADGYGAAVGRGGTGAVEVVVQPGRSESTDGRIAVSAVLARFNLDVAIARDRDVSLARARALTASVPDYLTEDEDRESAFAYTAPSNLVLFAFITALVTSAAIVDARRSGVTRRVMASPTSASAVVGGELVAAVLTALFQAAVMFVVGAMFFGVNFGSPAGVMALILSIALVSAAAGSVLATLVRTPEQSITFGPPIGIALGMLGGCMWPLEDVGPVVRAAGHLAPHAWAMDGFVELIFVEAGIADIALELAVLVLMSIGLLAVATARLRRSILL